MSLSQLPRFMRALTCEPLAVERGFLDAFVGVINLRAADGLSFTGADLHAELGVPMPRAQGTGADGRIAVIPIMGAIANRAHSMGTGADRIAAMVDEAVNSARVDGIVFDVHSPGGTVVGTPELADTIFRASQVKPTASVANGLMASAAYWAGAAANEVVVTPSGEIGGIGIIALHEDHAADLEAKGIRVTEFSAGKYKTQGAPWKALTEEDAAYMDSRVQTAYDWFVKDVARFRTREGRNVTPAAVRSGYGEGRALTAKDAVAAGLADRIDSLEGTIARMAAVTATKRRARVSAEVEFRQRTRARG